MTILIFASHFPNKTGNGFISNFLPGIRDTWTRIGGGRSCEEKVTNFNIEASFIEGVVSERGGHLGRGGGGNK